MTFEQAVSTVTRELIDAEEASGWSTLRRAPSTALWRKADYLAALSDDARGKLCDAFALRGANRLYAAILGQRGASLAPDPYEAGDEEFRRYVESGRSLPSKVYLSPRSLRQAAAYVRSPGYRGELDHIPRELLERAQSIHPAKAAQTSKRVKAMLIERFAAKPEKWGGGTRFRCEHDGQEFTMMPDYGGRTAQLRYLVAYVPTDRLLSMATLDYQEVLGIRAGDWDSITEENLDDVVELLARHLAIVAELPQRVAARRG